MSLNMIVGLLVILLSYSTTWFLLIKSVTIIKKIDEEGLEDIDVIKDKLDLRG